MSNMSTNYNNVEATKNKQSANKLEVNQNPTNPQKEEFVSDFDFTSGSANQNNFVETTGKTGIKEPVSERSAWH